MESETPPNERKKWETIFGTLVAMLQSQQQQLHSLVDERSLLQDRFKHQNHNWVSDVEILESQSSQMKREVSLAEKSRNLEIGKSQLLDSLNRSKSLISNLKLEYAESDLVDLWTCFELLHHKLTEYELSHDKSKETGDNDNSMADELLKLKRAYDNLESKHKSEISTLLSEKDFVWNQFRNMENECTATRKSAQVELEQANEKIQILMTNTEQLQLSSTEKDEIISKLKSDIAKLVAENENKGREISRLNSRGAPLTPVLNSSTARARAALKTSSDRRSLKKEASSSQASEKDSRGSKRKEAGNIHIPIPTPIPIAETPKLFSSKFRVPKLKTASPCTSASTSARAT